MSSESLCQVDCLKDGDTALSTTAATAKSYPNARPHSADLYSILCFASQHPPTEHKGRDSCILNSSHQASP